MQSIKTTLAKIYLRAIKYTQMNPRDQIIAY